MSMQKIGGWLAAFVTTIFCEWWYQDQVLVIIISKNDRPQIVKSFHDLKTMLYLFSKIVLRFGDNLFIGQCFYLCPSRYIH